MATLWGHWQLQHRLPSNTPRADWQLRLLINDLPQRKAGVLRFNARVLNAHSVQVGAHPLRQVRLSWYQPSVSLEPGMMIDVQARLTPPHGLSNPGGFDYPRWLLSRGLDATGYVRQLSVIDRGRCCRLQSYRQQLHSWLEARYRVPDTVATAAALLLGVKQGFDERHWQLLRSTGTVHLAVISGLHIGFAVLLGWWLGRQLQRWRKRVQDARGGPVVLGLLCGLLYALLAGMALPTQRAMLMVAVLLGSFLLQWRTGHWQRWWLAMAVVLTLAPLAFYEAGFWLSFGAVAVLLWLAGLRRQGAGLLRVQLAIFIGMLPLLAWWFSGFSILAPLVNLLAIPYVAMMLLLFLLDGLLALLRLDLLLPLVDGAVALFWWGLAAVADWPLSHLQLPQPDLPATLLALLGSGLLLMPRGFPIRYLGLLLWLPLLTGQAKVPVPGRFEAWLFDVGQGLSVYVTSGNKHLLYDTGPAYRSGGSAAERAVLPALRSRQVDRLDQLIISHNDIDHAGGREAVLARLPVAQRLTGSPELLSEAGMRLCRPGRQWRWGGVDYRLLAGGEGVDDNDRSCVLEVRNRHCSLLLPGDIGSDRERTLLPSLRPVTWLVASHHGSRFSSSRAFLQQLAPEYLLFSAGYANPFQHPHPDVRARADALGIQMLDTVSSGAIRLIGDADGRCRVTAWRPAQSGYWH
ncbi:DNA internalization-related competence protein ComEC/Rec2 [Marinobacterium sp. CAU 1594]|nr:DNA internalization-related competence protein ComEC/Rec2 [Marinobacterium arenosum]